MRIAIFMGLFFLGWMEYMTLGVPSRAFRRGMGGLFFIYYFRLGMTFWCREEEVLMVVRLMVRWNLNIIF